MNSGETHRSIQKQIRLSASKPRGCAIVSAIITTVTAPPMKS
jgi:hypothetical protein